MLVACWSVKGGAGTTVVSAALALVLARSAASGACLVDLGGDVPAVLGLADPTGPGLADWLGDESPPVDGLVRFELPAGPGLRVVPRGGGPLTDARADVLAGVLAADPRPVVADCGLVGPPGNGVAPGQGGVALTLAAGASRSLLVLRPCFLALRRAAALSVRPSAVVLVAEEGRAITARDVESVLDVPVAACVRVTPQIARLVDAGMLSGRLPRTLLHDLRHAA